MTAVIRASLKFRLLVVAVAAGVLALGISQLRDAPVDVLPEFTPPYAEIQTEALGLSATEVENLITVPLEADLLNGVQGVEVIRSESLPGLSSIVLIFEPGTDVYRGRQLVQERLAHAHALPRVSKPPTLLQPLSSSSRVLMIGLSSDRVSAIEQSVLARWTLRPRLMGVPGVANVAVWGMRDQQIQVQVDPERLRDRDVRLATVVETAGNAQIVSPLSFLEASTPGSGGFIETPQQRLQVRHALERLADPRELAKVPVEDTGGRLRLGDVADIRVGHQPLIGDAVVNDGDGLLLVVEKFPGADTLAVTRGVEAALETLRPGLSGIRTDTSAFRPAEYIEDAIGNLRLALIIGAALAALALVALLFQWRTVFVAAVAVTLSLVAAALVLGMLGETLNAISFAGLAAAILVIVDEAVVSAVAAARAVRARARGGSGLKAAVADASDAVRRPLAYGTLIALLAIAPIAVMEGRPGAFFEPLALAYVLAVLTATLVALTVTPALALLLFTRGTAKRFDSPLLGHVQARYDAALRAVMRHRRACLVTSAACVVAGLALLPLFETSVVPAFEDRNVVVRLDAEPGISQPRMTATATAVGREIRRIPGVESVAAHTGRAVTGDQRVDVNSSELWLRLTADADHDAVMGRIGETVDRVADVRTEVATYSEDRIRDVGALRAGENRAAGTGVDVLTGSDRPVVARLYGHDLAQLRSEADRIRQVMTGIDGVVDPRVDVPQEQPNLVIEADLTRAQRLSIKPGDVRRAEATLLQGIQVGSVFEDQKVFDVIVIGVPETRKTVADVRDLLIDRPGGGHVRLGQVADVRVEATPVGIRREAVSRYIDVEAGVAGRSADAVAADLRAGVAELSFPLEYHVEVITAETGEEIGATAMAAVAVVAAFAAFLLLQAAFGSWRLAALSFLLLPLSLVGGLPAALLDGAELSLGSLIGFLAVFALALRTTVLSVRRLQQTDQGDNGGFGELHVRRAAQDRLIPLLATAGASALLVLPLIVFGTRPGLEVVHPMAVVVLGGLFTSTLVALFALPALFMRFGTGQAPVVAPQDRIVRRWSGIETAGGEGPAPAADPRVGAGNGPAGSAEAQESER